MPNDSPYYAESTTVRHAPDVAWQIETIEDLIRRFNALMASESRETLQPQRPAPLPDFIDSVEV